MNIKLFNLHIFKCIKEYGIALEYFFQVSNHNFFLQIRSLQFWNYNNKNNMNLASSTLSLHLVGLGSSKFQIILNGKFFEADSHEPFLKNKGFKTFNNNVYLIQCQTQTSQSSSQKSWYKLFLLYIMLLNCIIYLSLITSGNTIRMSRGSYQKTVSQLYRFICLFIMNPLKRF